MDVRDASRSVVNRADFQARQFLDTFADLVRGLRQVEGRKEVILVSEGFHADNVGRDLERVAAAAALFADGEGGRHPAWRPHADGRPVFSAWRRAGAKWAVLP